MKIRSNEATMAIDVSGNVYMWGAINAEKHYESKMLDQELEVLESKKILLRAQYEEVCAIYRDANIHARRDEMDGAHTALRPLELDFRNTGIDFHTSELIGVK